MRHFNARARTLALSTPRRTRLFPIAEIVVWGMPVSLASCFWLSSCSSRMMQTESPTEIPIQRLAERSPLITNSTREAFCSRAGTQGDLDLHRARCCGKELDSPGEADVSCAICATTSEYHAGIQVRTSGGTYEAIGRQGHDQSIYAYWTSLSSPALRSLENVEREVMHGAANLRIHVNMASAATESVAVVQLLGRHLQGVPIQHQIDR